MTSREEKQAGQGASTAKPAFGSAWPGFDPASLTLNPMMANPAAAMAAMAQIGLEMQTQFATAMFGMMQTAMEASQRLNRTLEEMMPQDKPEAPVSEAAVEPAQAAPKPTVRQPAKTGDVGRPVRAKAAKAPEAANATKAAHAADDLTRISGLGPKMETKLNGLGITTLSAIAGWSAEEAARVDAELGLDGRVTRDDWVGQAQKLGGTLTSGAQELPPVRAQTTTTRARKTGGRKNRT